jgi:hypothetical protein
MNFVNIQYLDTSHDGLSSRHYQNNVFVTLPLLSTLHIFCSLNNDTHLAKKIN